MRTCLVATMLLTAACCAVLGDDDMLLADFEAETYGDWTVTGEAFGPGPARGTLAGQMPVSGFLGKRLVNSFFHGDDTTGTLTSPEFKIERKFINFLVGGGKYPGETCIDLVLEGKTVRTATGPNDKPGGSEQLDWHSWDVSELAGKRAVIRIVDMRTGGWGHINVDHIVQSDKRRGTALLKREIALERRYLLLPVKNGSSKRRLKITSGETTVREFEIELADGEPDFWVFCDLAALRGRKVVMQCLLADGSQALDAVKQSDVPIEGDDLYREKHRPQFHFTSRRGWLNDPNGLVYFDGEYHLFYQHNPYGWGWGNMHWGHAVSRDLVRWEELGNALVPREFGDWCFSGSAVVDEKNTSGFGAEGRPPLVAAFTSTGRGECIVYSNDRGRTWHEYEKNPVVRHEGRDPRLLWHEGAKHWVMAVYDESKIEGTSGRLIAFYSSPNLKDWKFESRIDGFFECPDLFALPVDGDAAKQTWVLYAADGKYVLGQFDGRTFTPETERQQLWHGNFYAAQTFSNGPDGRRIQIGWANGVEFKGMPFNQQMTVPVELSLRTIDGQVRMCAEPVRQIESLRGTAHERKGLRIASGEMPLDGVDGELLDIDARLLVGSAQRIGFVIRGVPLTYDVAKKEIACNGKTAPLAPREGEVRLRIVVDRGSVEVFGNDGEVALSAGVLFVSEKRELSVFSEGGEAEAGELRVWELKSAWSLLPHAEP